MAELGISQRRKLLARTPLFAQLAAAELERVARLFDERAFRKGEVVFREGDPGDTFLVVASGELEVRGGPSERLLNRLGPGDVLGEMALLFENRRSASVTASRSARLLVLGRSEFNRHFAANPKVLHYFSRLLSQRLAANARGEVARKSATVASVLGAGNLEGKSLVAATLAALLKRFTGAGVLLVRVQPGARASGRGQRPLALDAVAQLPLDRLERSLEVVDAAPARLGVTLTPGAGETEQTRGYNALLSALGPRFPFFVLDVDGASRTAGEAAEQVSDFVLHLTDDARPGDREADSRVRTFPILNLYNRGTPTLPINHCEPFVLPRERAIAGRPLPAAVSWLLGHPRSALAVPLRRLARKILGTSVGVAVGGGAAFGISHVGVLKVFEENDVPVDLLAGTSMGSIVALGYAAGITPAEMLRIARRIGNRRTTLSALDFTLTRPGILAGNRLVEIFSPLLGSVRSFEQLRYPCRTVATDIETGERVSIGEGPLEAAFRASCSVPILWAPVRHGNRVLVDGAMNDPVPAEVVGEMGADLCIAVNVVPHLKKGVDNILTRSWRRVNRLNPLALLSGDRHLPSMFDIYMNSLQTLQHELGNFKAISADVRIVPDLSDFTWIEFYRPEAIIERGVAAAERALPEIQQLLKERTARTLDAPGPERVADAEAKTTADSNGREARTDRRQPPEEHAAKERLHGEAVAPPQT